MMQGAKYITEISGWGATRRRWRGRWLDGSRCYSSDILALAYSRSLSLDARD